MLFCWIKVYWSRLPSYIIFGATTKRSQKIRYWMRKRVLCCFCGFCWCQSFKIYFFVVREPALSSILFHVLSTLLLIKDESESYESSWDVMNTEVERQLLYELLSFSETKESLQRCNRKRSMSLERETELRVKQKVENMAPEFKSVLTHTKATRGLILQVGFQSHKNAIFQPCPSSHETLVVLYSSLQFLRRIYILFQPLVRPPSQCLSNAFIMHFFVVLVLGNSCLLWSSVRKMSCLLVSCLKRHTFLCPQRHVEWLKMYENGRKTRTSPWKATVKASKENRWKIESHLVIHSSHSQGSTNKETKTNLA